MAGAQRGLHIVAVQGDRHDFRYSVLRHLGATSEHLDHSGDVGGGHELGLEFHSAARQRLNRAH
jgi:hypothetical protein